MLTSIRHAPLCHSGEVEQVQGEAEKRREMPRWLCLPNGPSTRRKRLGDVSILGHRLGGPHWRLRCELSTYSLGDPSHEQPWPQSQPAL